MIKESIQHKDTIFEILYASENASSTYMKPNLSEKREQYTNIWSF
jgi:hypothetical protein